MSMILLFVLALGLATDAFAVAVSNGMCYGNIGKKEALCMALTFGLFQGIMPVIGYYGGMLAETAIETLDHWIALVLLCFIGGSMALESLRELRMDCGAAPSRILSLKTLLLQGVATSIDALAVGISLAALGAAIGQASAMIGLVTFFVCFAGALLGRRFGSLLSQGAKFCGGVLLVFIGLKIFMEHTIG